MRRAFPEGRQTILTFVLLGGLYRGGAAQTVPAEWTHSVAAAEEAVETALAEGAAPGAAVAVAASGRIVWSQGFGFADLERGIPVTRATRFGTGSISKAFTLAAALVLSDQGRLEIDAPVERYLPDFPHRGRGITVRRIGAHQSGLTDDFAARHYYSTVRFPDLDSAYRHIRAERVAYTPGTLTEYATGLFTIVGRVLERVGGQPYPELIQRLVFQPAGMSGTLPNDPRRTDSLKARFYTRTNGGKFQPAPAIDPGFKLPGAGFLAPAEDVARFGAALLRAGLLSERSRSEMFAPVPLADGTPTRYALGFQALEEMGRRLLLQPGGGPGIASWLAIYPDDDLVVAILSNATGAPLGEVVREVAAAFFTPPLAPGASSRPAPDTGPHRR